MHPRDLSLHLADARNGMSAAAAAVPAVVPAASTAASAAVGPAATPTSDVADGYSLALKLHDFSAALAAATGGAYSTAGSGGGGSGADQWLCTEQDPSYSAPEVGFDANDEGRLIARASRCILQSAGGFAALLAEMLTSFGLTSLQVVQARLNDGHLPAAEQAAADVWSAGAVLFALLAGAPPFSRPSDAALPPQAKAVATLLRINSGDRNALHAQVCQIVDDAHLESLMQTEIDRYMAFQALLLHLTLLSRLLCANAGTPQCALRGKFVESLRLQSLIAIELHAASLPTCP